MKDIMSEWMFSFELAPDAAQGEVFGIKKDDKTALSAVFDAGYMMVSAYFTASENPLNLVAPAAPGDRVSFVYRPWRIELWINGEVADENWQYGEARFDLADIEALCGERGYPLTDVPAQKEPACVVGHFTNALGWRPGENVFVGDCMPYSHDGRYHVLYLKDRRHHGSKWGMGAHQWNHVSSADLVNWDIHPMAVPIDDPSEASICTGSWLEKDGLHRLYYAVRQNDWGPAPIRRSFSKDGYHYEKDRDFSVYLSERYLQKHARDPKIIFGADKKWHMLVTTTDLPVNKGCLAHLVSDDELHWTELEPEITVDTADEPECPDYFFYKGRYYILYSVKGKAHYKYSDKPFGAWIEPAEPIIDCGSVPKCAVWNDRLIFTGFTCIGGYAGALNFLEAKADENGELSVFPVAEMQ